MRASPFCLSHRFWTLLTLAALAGGRARAAETWSNLGNEGLRLHGRAITKGPKTFSGHPNPRDHGEKCRGYGRLRGGDRQECVHLREWSEAKAIC